MLAPALRSLRKGRYGTFRVLFELKWQGERFTDEIAMIRNRGPHSGITLLPSDNHAPRR